MVINRFKEDPVNAREHVLAVWPDGGRLSRLTELEEDDASRGAVVLGYFVGDDGICVLDFHAFSGEVQDFQKPQLEASDHVRLPSRRICWFILSTVPSVFLDRQIEEETVELLGLPLKLGTEWAVLTTDHPLEVEARRRHEVMMREFRDSPFEDAPDFEEASPEENMDYLLAVSEAVFGGRPQVDVDDDVVVDDDVAYLPFVVCGRAYILVHSFLRRDRPHLADGVRKWIGKNGPASFYVRSVEYLRVLGAGRSPAESLRNAFLWPSDQEAWERKHLEPGRLTFEGSDLWAMLGEFSAPWWRTDAFLAWAKDCPDLPVGIDPRHRGRW